MLLQESGIQLPKKTKSVKVLAHSDFDGFVSALLTTKQLLRQGIPVNRITIEWVQYSDNDLLDKATKKNPFQTIVSVDFSAYPTADLEYLFSVLTRSSGNYKEKFETKYQGSFQHFEKNLLPKKPSEDAVRNYILTNVGDTADLFKNPNKVKKEFEMFMKGIKNFSGKTNKIPITDIDYASDHHDNVKGDLVSGKYGSIGKTDFKSDAEHIATVSAQNLMNWDDVQEVSKIDSARYTDIENTISMSQNLKGEGRKERLAVLCAALVNQLIGSNPRLASQLAKEAQPSLLSIYTHAIKINKLNDNELAIFAELKKETPDFSKIEQLSSTLPKTEQKKVLKSDASKGIKPTASLEMIRNKNLKSKEENTKKETTRFETDGNVIIQTSGSALTNPPRYLGGLLSKEGKRYPFIIKEYPFMLQVQVNASAPEELKKEIDLGEICKRAVAKAEQNFGTKSNQWVWEIINSESGGHKTIWNISGINVLGSASLTAQERAEMRYMDDFKKRITSLKQKEAKKKLQTNSKNIERLKELDSKKTNSSFKKDVLAFIKKEVISSLNSKYKDIKIAPYRDDYEIK